MRTMYNLILVAWLGLAVVHSCFAASSTITFADGYFWAHEEQGNTIVEVRRSGDTTSTATIDYVTFEGMAKPGVDYVGTSGTLAFAPGESSKRFSMTVLDNGWLDGDRTLSLRLSNPVGATLGTVRTAVLSIADNETPVMADPTFQAQTDGWVEALALQPDGRLVVGGSFTNVNGVKRLKIARLRSDGSLDASFDSDSTVVGDVRTIALQPDGKILLAGDKGIVRLNANGSVDGNFKAAIGEPIRQVILLTGGKIIVLGARLIRLNPEGSLDPAFSTGIGGCEVVALAVQADGKLLVGGGRGPDCNQWGEHIGLARFHPDGSLDPTFQVVLERTTEDDNPSIISILPLANGQIVISGDFNRVNGTPRSNVARLNADGSLDATFRVADQIYRPYLAATQPNGKILIFEYPWQYSPWERINEDGSLDPRFRWRAPGGPLVIQPDGKVIVGGYHGVERLFAESSGLTGFELSPAQWAPAYTTPAVHRRLEVTVFRLGDTAGSARVDYATRDGTALAGVDYLPQNGTLTFGALDTAKTVSISILDDPSQKREQIFTFVLSNPSNGGILGVSREATVTITPQQFLTIDYRIPSVGGPVRLTLAPTEPGVSYFIHGIGTFDEPWRWVYGEQKKATSDTLEFEDATATRTGQRFYLIERLGPL